SQAPGEAAVADLDAPHVHRAHGAGGAAGAPQAAPGPLRARVARGGGVARLFQPHFRGPGLGRAWRRPGGTGPMVGTRRCRVARCRGDPRSAGPAAIALPAGGGLMSVLDRYIVRTVLGAVGLVMLVLLILGGLLVFFSQQGDIGVGHYTVADALWYTVLNLPQQVYELLPITALIGSLLGFGQLARGSEMTVIRATGVSVSRLAGTALVAAVLLIAFEGLLGEFVAPQLQEAANQQKAFSQFNSVGFGGGAGAWVRDGDLILNVARQSGSRQFVGMQVFELSPQHTLLSIGHAASATAAGHRTWLLGAYTESRFTGDGVTTSGPGEKILQSNVTAGFLGLAVQDPEQLTLRAL